MKAVLGDRWFYRVHVNQSILFERIGPDATSATAICFHYKVEAPPAGSGFPAPTVSNARYAFEREEGTPWRLARREHYLL